MRICFDLPHVFNRGSTEVQNAVALRTLLDCLTQLNVDYLRFAQGSVPQLYRSGVRYGRTDTWMTIPELYGKKIGDCKSLAPALAAEYIVRGIPARAIFRFNPNKKGGNDYHILVQVPRANGIDKKIFEDPSRKLGMGKNESRWFL